MTPPLIRTPRLRLRPLAAGDLERLHALNARPEVRRYLFDDEAWSLEEVRDRLVVESQRLWREERTGLFTVTRPAHDELAGWAGFWYFHGRVEREVVYAIDPALWGQGYGSEAALGVMAWGARVLGDTVFRASVDAPNERSRRVLAGLGFTEVERTPGRGHEVVHLRRAAAGLDLAPVAIEAGDP